MAIGSSIALALQKIKERKIYLFTWFLYPVIMPAVLHGGFMGKFVAVKSLMRL
ncbi:Hypothetical protein Minf_1581 [Methylacidiphilum infernorum V4]|uniref:Uncharacterized protein n=1 Tax=Methylacidiphilum infernorum (isolate V4) TaxID=481448 RepID=B3DWD2_METI4|nr:Hypothetical protein Minf_1581 [Methylacidiphilum infernorum V4]